MGKKLAKVPGFTASSLRDAIRAAAEAAKWACRQSCNRFRGKPATVIDELTTFGCYPHVKRKFPRVSDAVICSDCYKAVEARYKQCNKK